ncbi:MAG TPA: M23 family metallopeptidase, partial [Mycobacteriales bacterium]|nr:M23 family metallopeptidase [Mycobacteriales bacterium]
MRLGVCCGLVALSGAATLPAYAAKPTDAQRPVPLRRTETVNHKSACDASHAAASSYGWPVKPFWRPHPVRGNFGDPRTSFFGPLNQLTAGAFRFHNGIDISAPDGTAVYAVTSGRVLNVSADHLAAGSVGGHRHFQYWHILPVVRKGQRLTARRSVLGYVLPGQAHVHLTEFHRERVVNPLLPGHLYPYRDRRPPRAESLQFLTLDGQPLQASHLQGVVTVTATASDLPSLTPPGRWRD